MSDELYVTGYDNQEKTSVGNVTLKSLAANGEWEDADLEPDVAGWSDGG